MGDARQWLRGCAFALLVAASGALASFTAPYRVTAQNQETAAVTYHKDVAPILAAKCERCHAPGEMAPMALLTYQQVRPYARSIRLKVSKREMPPWFIDPSIGIQEYKNDMSLTDAQIGTIVKWVDGGAPEGRPAAGAPQLASQRATGWDIGTPDLIVKKTTPFKMYAKGSDWWDNEVADTNLTEERWVQAAQLKPGTGSIVHHFCSGVTPPGAAARPNLVPGVGAAPPDRYVLEEIGAAIEELLLAGEGGGAAASAIREATTAGRNPQATAAADAAVQAAASDGGITAGAGALGCYLPGFGTRMFAENTGIKIPAGGRIRFGMHYSASGEESTDQSMVALKLYPKGVTPKYEVKSTFFQKFPAFELDIPPNSVVTHDAYFRLEKPTKLLSFTPHMHFRGRALVLEAILPTGRVVTISAVKNYNFAWQLEYLYADDKAPLLPANTVLHAIVTHDNTANNPHNPDPNRWVGYGQASAEEMAGTFLTWIELSPEDFRKESAERRAKERAASN